MRVCEVLLSVEYLFTTESISVSISKHYVNEIHMIATCSMCLHYLLPQNCINAKLVISILNLNVHYSTNIVRDARSPTYKFTHMHKQFKVLDKCFVYASGRPNMPQELWTGFALCCVLLCLITHNVNHILQDWFTGTRVRLYSLHDKSFHCKFSQSLEASKPRNSG